MKLDKTIPLLLVGLVAVAACGGQGEQSGTQETAAGETPAAQTQGMQGMQQGAEGQMPEGHPPVAAAESAGGVTVMRIAYKCADGKTMELAMSQASPQVEVTAGDQSWTMQPQDTESGMLYSDGTVTFHGQGMDAWLEKGGEKLVADCKAQGHPMQ